MVHNWLIRIPEGGIQTEQGTYSAVNIYQKGHSHSVTITFEDQETAEECAKLAQRILDKAVGLSIFAASTPGS